MGWTPGDALALRDRKIRLRERCGNTNHITMVMEIENPVVFGNSPCIPSNPFSSCVPTHVERFPKGSMSEPSVRQRELEFKRSGVNDPHSIVDIEDLHLHWPVITGLGEKPAECTSHKNPDIAGLSCHKNEKHSDDDYDDYNTYPYGDIFGMIASVVVMIILVVSELNGNNGEATNGDDLDQQQRARNHREANNHRHNANPGAVNRPPTFNNLLQQYMAARRAVVKAWKEDDPLAGDMQNHERVLRAEIITTFPDKAGDVPELLVRPPVIVPPPEEIPFERVRLYILATTGNSYVSVLTIVMFIIAILLLDVSVETYVVEQGFCVDMFPVSDDLVYGEFPIPMDLTPEEDFCLPTLYAFYLPSVFSRLAAFILSLMIFAYYALFGLTTGHSGKGGVTPDFVGDSNTPIAVDPTYTKMKVVPNTFWFVKGYTHYVDISIPKEYLKRNEGSAWQVISGCSTDSQLSNIAYVTLSRSLPLLKYYSTVGARLPHDHEFYCRYAAMYVAQQHMYHLFQTMLMTARSGKVTLDGWTGSDLNFRYGGRIHGIIELGCIRQYFEDSLSKDQWIDNGRFHISRSVKSGVTLRWNSKQQVYTPQEWRTDIGFSEVDHLNQKRLKRYRTKLLTFHNGGVLYARTNANLYSALNRMFTARENDQNLEKELVDLQTLNVRCSDRRLGKLFSQIVEQIKRKFPQECEFDDLLGQLKLIQESHPKKKLREEAFEYIQKMTLIKNSCYATKVTAKVKIEVAKFLKNARVYVDMTTPQSLVGGWLVDPLKNAMKDVDLGWCAFKFAKCTDEASLTECFTFLRDNAHRPVCVFHSDDAVMQLPCSDGVLIFNLDISSCDRSNTKAIFDMLLNLIPDGPWKFLYERMVQGCLLDLVIPNPSVKNDYIRAKPLQPFEYSGCNLTTVLNNVALLSIAASIFHAFRSSMTKEQAKLLVPQRAKSVGYLVTVQVCQKFEQVQFLKYSPSDIVNCYPVRNLGCVLRAVGHFDGDLPGSGDIALRALDHVKQVVTGITTGYIDPVSHILRNKFTCSNPKSNKYQWEVANFVHTVPYTFLYNRYGLDEYQVDMLSDIVRNVKIGDYVTSPILDTIFRIDYG